MSCWKDNKSGSEKGQEDEDVKELRGKFKEGGWK